MVSTVNTDCRALLKQKSCHDCYVISQNFIALLYQKYENQLVFMNGI